MKPEDLINLSAVSTLLGYHPKYLQRNRSLGKAKAAVERLKELNQIFINEVKEGKIWELNQEN